MYTLTTNQNSYKTTITKTDGTKVSGNLNDAPFEADILKVREDVYSIIKDGRSYEVELVKHIPEDKKLVVKVNNTSYTLDIKDKYDDLLHSLGLDSLATKKVNDIKAPMPGMVLNIFKISLNPIGFGGPHAGQLTEHPIGQIFLAAPIA